MIGRNRVLAVIPARGGSKGLPHKNVLEVDGRPMIAWSIDAATHSEYIDRCIISTDDPEISAVARACGGDIPFTRPAELARDDSVTLDVVLHAIEQLPGYDIVVLLQPTSPLRTTTDIDKTIEAMIALQAPSATSVYEPAKSPYWAYRTDENDRLVSLLAPELASKRRQELPAAYVLNGAVYVARIDWLRDTRLFVNGETVAHVMPAERSLDVDTDLDLKLVNFLLREQRLNQPPTDKPRAAHA